MKNKTQLRFRKLLSINKTLVFSMLTMALLFSNLLVGVNKVSAVSISEASRKVVAPTITVTSPNGGEMFTVGKTYKINWKSTGAAASRKVQIGIIDTRFSTEGGERAEQIIAFSIPNDGSYSWKVPAKIGTMNLNVTTRPVYKIIVHSYLDLETGIGLGDLSNGPFAIQDLSPVISSLSPVNGLVGSKVKITGSGFRLPNKVIFVGSTNAVVGQGSDTVSPINGEFVSKDVKPTDDNNLVVTIPSKMSAQGGEDGKSHLGADVIPGNYYFIVETDNGKSTPTYFKVRSKDPIQSTSTPVQVSPTITSAGEPGFVKAMARPDQTGAAADIYTATFNVKIKAEGKDVVLGLSNSPWPLFGKTSDFVQIYKNGSMDPLLYGLNVNYAVPVGAIPSTDGMTFKVLAGSSVSVPVMYSFQVKDSSASLYGIQLKAVGFDSKVLGFNPLMSAGPGVPSATTATIAPVVTTIGTPLFTKNYSNGQTGASFYTASFEMNIANPLNTDIVLGHPNSSWPAFGTSSNYVQIIKNGVVDMADYNLSVVYASPTGAINSTDGKTFKILARSVANVRVSYLFSKASQSADIYKVNLRGLGWGTVTQPNQIVPLSISTPLAFDINKLSQKANVMDAFGTWIMDIWDGVFGIFR
ncbi:MAG: Ser-Thr-rich GPI-anchored membrane family protein [bacterium]